MIRLDQGHPHRNNARQRFFARGDIFLRAALCKEIAAGLGESGHTRFHDMDMGQWMTRATVWLALFLYAAAEVAAARHGSVRLVRWLNSMGFAALLAHLGCAFQFHHHWSHSAAYAETARQTAELVGWNWGGGLFVNYAFVLVWLGDVTWFWTNRDSYSARPDWVRWGVRAFFLFMIFNGAVVFVHGAGRWAGLLLCITLIGCWWRTRVRGVDAPVRTRGA